MNKLEMIQKAIELQKEINRLIMEDKIQPWMELDLTINQLKSLIYIYNQEIISYKELAIALNVTPSVITGIVNRLVMNGLVKRKQLEDNAPDRRVQWLVLTEKGRSRLENIKQVVSNNTVQILQYMPEEDMKALLHGFVAFLKAADTFAQNRRSVRDTNTGT